MIFLRCEGFYLIITEYAYRIGKSTRKFLVLWFEKPHTGLRNFLATKIFLNFWGPGKISGDAPLWKEKNKKTTKTTDQQPLNSFSLTAFTDRGHRNKYSGTRMILILPPISPPPSSAVPPKPP